MRAILIAIHLGSIVVPAAVVVATGGTAALTGGTNPIITILSVAQGGLGAALARRQLRAPLSIALHVLAPTLTAWAGLAAALLGVAATATASGGVTPAAVEGWISNLATIDLTRQYAFLVAGWGWLAALASVALSAFAHRGTAPLKPANRLALIAAGCTLPAAVLVLGGVTTPASAIYILCVALLAGELMAFAAPAVSVWSRSVEPKTQSRAFVSLWLACPAVVVCVATSGLALSLRIQSSALLHSLLTDGQAALAAAARAQTELSTEILYLLAGVTVAWFTLAVRGRRVVLAPAVGGMRAVVVVLLLATSIGLANRAYEHGTGRRLEALLELAPQPELGDIALATVPLAEARSTNDCIRVTSDTMRQGDAALATRTEDGWVWQSEQEVGQVVERHSACIRGEREAAVAAPGTMAAAELAAALGALRKRGVCRVELLALRPKSAPPADLSPWVGAVINWRQAQPGVLPLFLVTSAESARRWSGGMTVADALGLEGAPSLWVPAE